MRRGLVVVTGANGCVGAQVVRALQQEGYQVRAAVQPGTAHVHEATEGLELVEAQWLTLEGAGRLLEGARGVIHAAREEDSSLPWEALFEAHAQSTEIMCEAALREGVDRFVFVSSAEVYGQPELSLIGEDTPRDPLTEWARSFALAEDRIWEAQRFEGLRASVLRPAHVYGPRSGGAVANLAALYATRRERPLPWVKRIQGGPLGHHVHAEDVGRAAVLLLQKIETIGLAYNLGDATPLRWGEVTEFLCGLCNVQCGALMLPGPVARAVSVMGQWVPSDQLMDLNRELADHWELLKEAQHLQGVLQPRLSRDLFEVLRRDQVLDIGAVTGLGFQWSYPRTLTGLREVFDWYMNQQWLPGRPDLKLGESAHA